MTTLDRKGDGVQSLVALALMRYASEQAADEGSTVIAIEEPESHLHPRAVHELRSVILTLAERNQVVLTSHSPLFVNANDLSNTIIVQDSKAAPAKHVSDIRETLGVRFSDNLHNARMVLLVEGTDDVTALKAIIARRSSKIKAALKAGTVVFDHLGGASGLRQKASSYSAGACLVQCLIDDDIEGRNGVERAIADRVLEVGNVNFCSVPHLKEAELEDFYDRKIYAESFLDKFGVDLESPLRRKSKEKWSTVTGILFRKQGKPWDKKVKEMTKIWLSEFAAAHAGSIINEKIADPLDNFVSSIERRLPEH